MSDPNQPAPPNESKRDSEQERTKQVEVAGWTAGTSAVIALGTLSTTPTWPMAIGAVAVVFFFILKR